MSPKPQAATDVIQKVRLPAWVFWAAAAVCLAIAAIYAYSKIFSQFAFYDDEGYMMISLRGFLDGYPLYDKVYTNYGPLYYFYQAVVHTLTALPVTHDVTGFMCLLHWLAASILLAVAGGWASRSFLIAFFIFMQAVVHLTGLSNEPGHPQELVAVLLAVAALVSIRGSQQRWALVVLGGIGAALVFTKINVGAFYAVALFVAFVCHSPLFRSRPALSYGLLCFTGLLPFLLMGPHLHEMWARDFAARAAMVVLAAGAMAYAFAGDPTVRSRQWIEALIGGAGLCAALVGILMIKGTSVPAMIDCLVTSPAKLASGLSFPVRVPHSMWLAVAASAMALGAILLRKRLDQLRLVTALAKAVFGVVGTLQLVDEPNQQLAFLLPWVWLLVVPARQVTQKKPRDTFARAFLCVLAAWQALQAYPAAGTQAALASFLMILVCSLCLHDALTAFAEESWLSQQLHAIPSRTALLFYALLLASLVHLFAVKWCTPRLYWQAYRSFPPLQLPGASRLHLPAKQAQTYRALAHYLDVECDTFVTLPGLNSLYFWTGKKPPTYLTIAEVVLMGDGQQEQIVAALQKAKRPLIVVSEMAVPFLLTGDLAREGPLARFVREECREVERLDGFRILAPKIGTPRQQAISAHSLL